jgi:hypothetical protein
MDYDNRIAEVAQRLGFQQEIGLAALRSLTLVNGGAVIGLLTFIGNEAPAVDPLLMRWSFGAFGAGLFFTLAAYLGGYFSQSHLMNMALQMAWDDQRELAGKARTGAGEELLKSGNRILLAAVACATTSLLCFGVGAFSALFAILP